MPLVSRKCIEEIKSRVEIHDVVAPYVQLKRSGSSWRGLSPFSAEKTPSFFVLPDKGIFKCFSSGYAGDIFRFLQLKENLSFNEAIESVANRFNVALEYEEGSGPGKEQMSLNKEILKIHELATEFFQKSFHSEKEGSKWIQNYWTEVRKFSIETAKEYTIGFAPVNGEPLKQYLHEKHKFSIEAMQQCGLFYARSHDRDLRRFMPRFTGRLMIPIRDVQGRTIAFAGRQLELTPETDPAKDAKYINSPETPIFNKSRTLFGLVHARKFISETPYAILVEGQLDAIRCWEHGFNTTIAPQGTSITEGQLLGIRRYTDRVISILDGDEAGRKAALRILPMAFKAGLELSFIMLGKHEDPDNFLSTKGKEAFQEALNNPTSAMTFALQGILPNLKAASPREKSTALKQIFEILIHCDSSVAREEYLLEVTKLLNISRQSVDSDFNKYIQSQKRYNRPEPTKPAVKSENQKLTTVEYQLLLVILNNDNIANLIGKAINSEWISTETIYGQILLKLVAEIEEGLWEGSNSIDTLIDTDEERNVIYSILSDQDPYEDAKRAANMCLQTLYKNFLNQKKNDVDRRVANTSPNDSETITVLQRERIELRKLMQSAPKIQI